jgi:diacylglycerol kinase family enzyme
MIDINDIQTLVERAAVFAGKKVHVTVIANPVAGGFTMKKKALQNEAFFRAAVSEVKDRPVVTASCSAALDQTTAAGHAKELARTVLSTAVEDHDTDSMYLIVTAGGDGTSLDVQSEIARMYYDEGRKEIANKICVLRLPYGTGNDGSDGRFLDESLALLTGKSRFYMQRAVRVYPESRKANAWYSFNLASIGIDAFVTHMTNRVKGIFPGDFYKIWVDLACVFYNRIYHVGTMGISAYSGDGKLVRSHKDRMVLYLMGESGHRTYGSNQKILPGEDNVCGVREMPLVRKLSLRKHFKNGTHATFPETILYTADKMVIDYSERILVQMDGEAHLLGPSDFPLVMERTEPFITILKPAL